jgi:YfiR/HmsC-like
MRKLKSCLLNCVAVISVLCSVNATANAGMVSDTPAGQKTMSRFMESLARYITWPDSSFASPDAPYKYCLLGSSKITSALNKRLGDKKVKKRGFEIVELDLSAVEESKSCHVVFIAGDQPDDMRPIVDALSGLPVLTTGDSDKFAARGGMIGFFGEGKKVALQINKKRLETGNLKASSKLFRVSSF